MSKTIFVSNIPFTASEHDIHGLFSQFGLVQSISIISDKETGKTLGFGFVEMREEEAISAIKDLNGFDLDGRALQVNETRVLKNRKTKHGRNIISFF